MMGGTARALRGELTRKAVLEAAIVVLLVILLAMNAVAIYIRNRYSGKQYTGK